MNAKLLAAVVCLVCGSLALADDWPQFRGPDRTGVSKEKGLLKAWPKEGPQLLWTFKDAGIGFSTVSISKGVVYTLGTDLAVVKGKAECIDEYVIAIDEKKGTELWRTKLGPLFTFKKNAWGDGPRSTPTVDGDRLYALGAQGELVCLDVAKKGAVVWRKNLIKDFGGAMMEVAGDNWGYSESPLVDGDLLFCTPGGPKGTFLALKKKDGTVAWRTDALTHNAPYSSAVAADINGVRQFVQTSYDNTAGKETGYLSGIDAKTGRIRWSEPIFKDEVSYAIAPTPIVKGNQVYVTSNPAGCHLFAIGAGGKVKEVFAKKWLKKLINDHGGVVAVDGFIYGHSRPGMWKCQNATTGEIEWDENNILNCKSGSITAADGKLYLYTDDGVVGLVDADPNPKGVDPTKVSTFTIPVKSMVPQQRNSSRSSRTWAHPVIANGVLYVRDHEYIFAFKIAAK
jgi:outer membrane protein assembly factor BamB